MPETKRSKVFKFFSEGYNIDKDVYKKSEGALLLLIFSNLSEKKLDLMFDISVDHELFRLVKKICGSNTCSTNVRQFFKQDILTTLWFGKRGGS